MAGIEVYIMGAFLWSDLDKDKRSKISLDHGASKKPVNHRFI